MTHSPPPPRPGGACDERRLEPAVTPAPGLRVQRNTRGLSALSQSLDIPLRVCPPHAPRVLTLCGGVGLGCFVHMLRTGEEAQVQRRSQPAAGAEQAFAPSLCLTAPREAARSWVPISPSLVFRPTLGSG